MDFKHTDELCAAAKAGDAVRVKRAIEAGDSISSGRIGGVEKPPIIWAAMSGDVDCLRVLLDAGVEVDARADVGDTALMWAVAKANRGCMNLLLDAGADVNAKDFFGMTPAMWGARFGASDHSFIDSLVEAGADLRVTDAMRRTAATHAKISGMTEMSALIKARIAAADERKRLAKSLRSTMGTAQPRPMRM